MADYIY